MTESNSIISSADLIFFQDGPPHGVNVPQVAAVIRNARPSCGFAFYEPTDQLRASLWPEGKSVVYVGGINDRLMRAFVGNGNSDFMLLPDRYSDAVDKQDRLTSELVAAAEQWEQQDASRNQLCKLASEAVRLRPHDDPHVLAVARQLAGEELFPDHIVKSWLDPVPECLSGYFGRRSPIAGGLFFIDRGPWDSEVFRKTVDRLNRSCPAFVSIETKWSRETGRYLHTFTFLGNDNGFLGTKLRTLSTSAKHLGIDVTGGLREHIVPEDSRDRYVALLDKIIAGEEPM